ncbi:28S ribosomal protein S29, mitochondrial [Lamellibrachia satsuma]|nr:28S ribosomal protein S29, mitochondrial [Lamellibrachia satsuma]
MKSVYLARGQALRHVCRCMCSASADERTTQGTRESLAQQFTRAIDSHHQRRQIFRTTENDPANHTENHEAMFYTIPPEHFQRWLRRGLTVNMYRMTKAFNESSVMVRQPATELIGYLQMAEYTMPVIRYLLYGEIGSGKSTSLAHVMHYCGTQGWLILHVPWAAFFNRYSREIQPSVYRPGRLDQPLEAAEWIAYFKQMNEPLLKQLDIKVQNTYVWNKRESSDVGTPLADVMEFGLARVKYAADVVGAILKEIRQQAAPQGFKVLVAVDGVNAFWSTTNIKVEDDRTKRHDAGNLSLVHNFKKMIRNDWSNGAVIGTLDAYGNDADQRGSYLPRYVLGKEGFEWLDPHIPIYVPNYSEKEALSCLQYYIDRRWLQNPKALTEEGKEELLLLSSLNPFELYRVTAAQ